MIKYDFTNLDLLLSSLLTEDHKTTVVLFLDEPSHVLFNFEIIKFNNLSKTNFVKAPQILLNSLHTKIPSIGKMESTYERAYLYTQSWNLINTSNVESFEESLSHYIPIMKNQKYRSVPKIVIGPCESFEHIKPSYQFTLCDFLDEIEDRITRRIPLKIRFWDDGIQLKQTSGLIINTEFIDKTEFLVTESKEYLRLDRVYDMVPI